MRILVAIALVSIHLAWCSSIGTPSMSDLKGSWNEIIFQSEQSAHSPLSPVSKSWIDSSTNQDTNVLIFVGIITYRDDRCSRTLSSLFGQAKYPDRIRVGLIQQRHTEQDSYNCINDYCKKSRNCRRDQIVQIEHSHQDSKGPSFERYLQDSLIQDEEFCMQVDAHTSFVKDWDTVALETWGAADNEYAILSTRPTSTNVKETDIDTIVPHSCGGEFNNQGLFTALPPTYIRDLKKPFLAPLWTAGFSFSKCHAEKKVPSDPYLQFVFDGDEITKYARYWTRGYDVYTPHRIIVQHDYSKARIDSMEWLKKNGMWLDKEYRRYLYLRSMDRIATLLDYPDSETNVDMLMKLTKYGLGSKRTLDQWIRFTGIDTRSKTVFADRCTKHELSWVPYIVEDDPFVDSGDIWGGNPELLPSGGNNIPLADSSVIEVTYLSSDALFPVDASIIPAGYSDSNNLSNHEKNINLENLFDVERHRGKELWWMFQWLDSHLEQTINEIDREFGTGHGHRVVKLFLMVCPVLFVLLLLAASIIGCTPIIFLLQETEENNSNNSVASKVVRGIRPVKKKLYDRLPVSRGDKLR